MTYLKTKLGNEQKLKSKWISNMPLKVIIHGWDINSDEYNRWIFKIKQGKLYSIIINKCDFN